MKLKTFFFKNRKEKIRGQLWIPSLIGFSLFMLQTVMVMISFENWNQRQYRLTRIHQLCEELWRGDMMRLSGFVAAAAGILCGLYAFLYLHSSRKVDFYHSLPARREELFLKRVVIHLKHYLIPSAAVTFLSICACALQGEFSLKILGYGVGVWMFQLAIFLMSYGVTVLAVVLTGTPLLAALGTMVFHVYGLALSGLILGYMLEFFDTFYNQRYYIGSLMWPTPLGGGLYCAEQALARGNVKPVLLYILVMFLIWCAAFSFYKRRPSEAAGRSMAFPKLGILIKYMLQVPMTLGIGLVIQSFTDSSEKKAVWWIFGLTVGAIFGHVVMETLYSMNFRSAIKNKRHFACICMLAAVFMIVFRFDLTGYNTWYPKSKKLDKLFINLQTLSYEDAESLSQVASRYQGSARWWETGNYMPFSAESPMYDVLEAIAQKQGTENTEDKDVLLVNYRLTSGKEKKRKYFIDEQDAVNIMNTICMNPEYLAYKWPDYEEKKECLENVWFDIPYEPYKETSFGDDKKLEFYEAFRKDVEQAEISDYMECPLGSIYFDYEYELETEPEFIYETDTREISFTDSFYIFPGFENTLALMREEGMSLEFDAEDIKEIRLLDMTESRENPEETVYKDKGEIEELLPGLWSQGVWCAWLPYNEDYMAVLKLEQKGEDREVSMWASPELP